VLDTYFVFLRSRVVVGDLDIKKEHALIEEAREWIGGKAERHPGLARYLAAWGDWKSPWG
jgi:hypothetical protein